MSGLMSQRGSSVQELAGSNLAGPRQSAFDAGHLAHSLRSWLLRVSLVLTVFAALSASSLGLAQSSRVPAQVQAELIAKLASYDRNFKARARGTARVVLLVRKGNGKSELAAESFKSALAKVDRIGGLPHEEQTLVYENAAALVRLCQEKQIAIVYVTPGLEGDIPALRDALSGASVLTVAPSEEHVELGVVLGFTLVSGRPKLVLNLPQAMRQKVDFQVGILKLMKVRR